MRLCLTLSLFSCALSAGAQFAAPVTVAKAELRLLAPTTWIAGEVISNNDSQIAAEVEGRLDWVAEVGTRLGKGDAVARIDATLIKQESAEYQAIIEREQARLDFLDQEVSRLQTLVKQKSVSQSLLDKTLSDRLVARGDLAVAQAKARRVDERLARTTIRTPFAGVVTERFLQAGEWADGGKAIARVVDTESVEVRAWLTPEMLNNIRAGDALGVKVNEQRLQAPVKTVVRVGDSTSRMHEVRLRLTASPWAVGQSVRVAVPTAGAQQVMTVPRDALVLRRDGNAVFRIKEDSTAEKIAVGVGIAADQYIEVKGALQAGDVVVVNGGERLRSGQSVSVINPTEQAL